MNHVPSKHRPSLRDLRADLHLLLRLVLASETIANLVGLDIRRSPEIFESEAWEIETITTKLVSSAAILRVLDDAAAEKMSVFTTYCGDLFDDVQSGPDSVTGLTLREACNKVLHAESVSLERATHPLGLTFLRPFVVLHGQYRNKQWRARLNVVTFVRESLVAIGEV